MAHRSDIPELDWPDSLEELVAACEASAEIISHDEAMAVIDEAIERGVKEGRAKRSGASGRLDCSG
ncbi:hypothetical protein [Yunchengibacter salinarum]|uniref:hypothetical protein n=1 Tax=Yunchengibacter salinarum TaxID=3133399 RepID=UPI0035B60C78